MSLVQLSRAATPRRSSRLESRRTRAQMANAAPVADAPTVILGGGIIGASIAYYLTLKGVKPVVVERQEVACAASGKGGGFLAQNWGDGPTDQLHRVSFALHEELASTLGLSSYRRLPTLGVKTSAGRAGRAGTAVAPWLDGPDVASVRQMDDASGTAQVTPLEYTSRVMAAACAAGATVVIGTAQGIETRDVASGGRAVSAVVVDGAPLAASRVVFAMGPWTVLAGDWLGVPVPLEGILSASVVYRSPRVSAALAGAPAALFCGEDDRYGTHLEVYPRPNGEMYVCGIGGSDYVRGDRLRPGGDVESQANVKTDASRVAAARAAARGLTSLVGDGAPAVQQSCMRPCAPDALPIIGPVPGVIGAYLAAGHNCWGILWAPVTGKAVAELIVDGAASCVDLAPFGLERFMAQPAGRGRRQGAAAVGEQW